jgi:magnesium chelatase subunit I
VSPGDSPGRIAAVVELALESLYLARQLAKDTDDATTVYGP